MDLTVIAEIMANSVLLATLPGTLELACVTAGALFTSREHNVLKPVNCRLAVVIPAHNEAALIRRTVASVLASHPCPGGRPTVVVVADNCTDQTAAIATEAGARVLVRTDPEQRGKGHALRFAFEKLAAEGYDAFLVIDADSTVSLNLFAEMVRRLSAGAAAVQCRYQVGNNSASMRASLMGVAFLAFNVMRPRGRAGWGLSVGVLGNGIGLRVDTIRDVPYRVDSIVEDLEYHLRLVSAGRTTDFMDEATVFGEIPRDSVAARTQRSRWEGGRLRMAKEWVPRFALGVLQGRFQLFEPMLELLTLPLAYHVSLILLSLLLSPQRALGIAALCIVVVHVFASAMLGGQFWKTFFALAVAPFYLLWKLTTLDAVFAASRRTALWVRTDRD